MRRRPHTPSILQKFGKGPGTGFPQHQKRLWFGDFVIHHDTKVLFHSSIDALRGLAIDKSSNPSFAAIPSSFPWVIPACC
jgi:hypothetical protein